MKGYSEVSVEVATQAQENFEAWYKEAEELFTTLVDRYYDKHYTKGNRWTRWRNKKKSPGQFLLKHIGFCEPYSSVLCKVCNTKEEMNMLEEWESRHIYMSERRAIRALLGASTSDSLLLDQELCAFVEKWRDK